MVTRPKSLRESSALWRWCMNRISDWESDHGIQALISLHDPQLRVHRQISGQGATALTNGAPLAKHMVEHNLGVSVSRSYDVNRIDTDYFGEGCGDRGPLFVAKV
jgi:hypothetical protein